jgi:hypothetical protein
VTWQLDANASAAIANADPTPYNGGGPWDPSRCATQLTAQAQAVKARVFANFPAITDIGGLRCSPLHARSGSQMSIHAVGRSLDIMTSDPDTGNAVANWLVANAVALHIQLVIWDHMVWQGSLPVASRWTAYTGPNPHTDHVHAEVWLSPGDPETLPQTSGTSSSSDAPGIVLVVGVTVAAVLGVLAWGRRRRRR